MLKHFAALCLLLLACLTAASLLGGFEEVDVDDEGVRAAADHAAREISKKFAGKYHHVLVRVVKAKRQVVAGNIYKMDIIVGMTKCEKSGPYDTGCELQDNRSTYKKCTVHVLKDLKQKHKLVNSGCILASRDEV